ncbi:hypothetical protein [Microcoleus sp. D3_18_C4]|uniref:hypothetical protein n=1 Tax=Microcoleus sp. D3_18_C4 TaxID=3055335 RepID=UPI002FCF15A8
MIDLCWLMAAVASEGVELGVATGSLYLFLNEKVRLLGRNTVIMVVKYDYRQERVKRQQKKQIGGTQGRSHILKSFPSVLWIQIRGKM